MSFTYNERGLVYNGNETQISIPSKVNGREVRYLQPNCFLGSQVEQVTLPETLVEISAGAFRQCEQLTSVTIPASVKYIGGAAFQGCHSLKSVTIPASVIDIGGYAFDECSSLEEVLFEGPISYIGAYAFSDTALTDVVLPDGILQLGNSVFFNCQQLASVLLPQTTEVIGACAFAGCIQLQSITLPATVKIVLDGAFEYCQQLNTIVFNSIPRFIHEKSFADCPALVNITAPLQQSDFVELYDDKRHIFENDQQKLQQIVGMYTSFQSLFQTATDISFSQNKGPDYRLELARTESIYEQAKKHFELQQHEEVIHLLEQSDEIETLPLLARSYALLGETKKALQAYRQLNYESKLLRDDLVSIGRLLLHGTTIDHIREEDYLMIARNFLHS